MEILEFISEIVASIAWPVTALVFLSVGISNLGRIGTFVKSIKYAGLELTFHERIREAQSGLKIEEIPVLQNNEAVRSETAELIESAGPIGAILEIWKPLEDYLRGLSKLRRMSPSEVIDNLKIAHTITAQDYVLFHQLQEIRNLAAHRPLSHLGLPDVTNYKVMVDALLARIQKAEETSK